MTNTADRRKRLYLWGQAAAEIFFPNCTCLLCAGPSGGRALCPGCQREVSRLRPCSICATFIPDTETGLYRCRNCRGQDQPFVLARAAAPYAGHLRRQILAFKYRNQVGLRRPLVELLALTWERYYADLTFDAVVPLPLSPARLSERGYNQAQLLSEPLAARLGLEHRPDWLLRVKDTNPLASLTRSQRERELRGAFQAAPQAQGQRLLLIDDIYTTGASVAAAAQAARKQGAASVHVLTVAAGAEL